MLPIRLGLAVAALLVAACGPGGGTSASSPDASQPPGRAVSFTTADGMHLTGRLVGSGPVAVALAHMFPAPGASSWYLMAETLAEAGYTALAFDMRGYAGSDGPKDASRADVDLQAAYDYLRSQGADQVALLGASMGGTAALIVASRVPTPAVVAVSAPEEFRGLDASAAAPAVAAPVLLMAAQGDGPALQGLRNLAERLTTDETKLYEGEAHGTNLLEMRPEARDEVLAFLEHHAPPLTVGSREGSATPASNP